MVAAGLGDDLAGYNAAGRGERLKMSTARSMIISLGHELSGGAQRGVQRRPACGASDSNARLELGEQNETRKRRTEEVSQANKIPT